jgi:hypothetical protein
MERMASDILIPVRMKQADMSRADVQAFRCGSRPHEMPLAAWLKVHSAERIRCGYKVWLYYRQTSEVGQGPLVGYGSLTKGYIETTEEDGGKKRLKVMEIPELALHEDFWGCPKGIADPEGKYSRQIVRHLQQQARIGQEKGQNIERLLVLYVHPDAVKAQGLYRACGFVFAPGRFLADPDINPDSGFLGLLGMDYRLDQGDTED